MFYRTCVRARYRHARCSSDGNITHLGVIALIAARHRKQRRFIYAIFYQTYQESLRLGADKADATDAIGNRAVHLNPIPPPPLTPLTLGEGGLG